MGSAESKKSSETGLQKALVWAKVVLSIFKRYWVRVVIIAIIGIWLGEELDDTEYWITTRYEVYQLLQHLSPRRPHPQRTVLVLIGDDEYWKGELQARAPIKRDYLARIVEAASAANAAVIALDFDLRSPSPDGNPRESPEYQVETKKLIDAITTAASSGKKIVLTKTIAGEGDNYVIESDIYDPIPPGWQNVRTGYHVLADDTRRLPPVLKTKTGLLIDPFSLAIARAENASSLENVSDFTATLYAGFLPANKFAKVSADDLLHKDLKAEIANKVVIVSGVWHQLSYHRGPEVSAYGTPAGDMPGVFIHANYFEALWDSRIYRVWEGWGMRISEFILALLVALPFALTLSSKRKRAAIIAFPYLLIAVGSYVSLINFGWFFDPFIPVLSISAHGALERVLQWKAAAANVQSKI